MRLTASEQDAIREEAASRAPGATVYLFGSRADDGARGGDIDLLVFPCRMEMESRLRFRIALADRLGEQKIDLVVSDDATDPFVRIAREYAEEDLVPLFRAIRDRVPALLETVRKATHCSARHTGEMNYPQAAVS